MVLLYDGIQGLWCNRNPFSVFSMHEFFRKPLNAENHDVLDLSSTPIVEIIFGARGSVWIVKESSDYVDDHCKRILLHY